MRTGFQVELVGSFEAPLDGVAAMLDGLGLEVAETDAAAGDPACVRVASMHDLEGIDDLREIRERTCRGAGATLAVLSSSTPDFMSLAAAIDCDDAIALPLGRETLGHRIERLRQLALCRLEWTLRSAILDQLGKRQGSNGLYLQPQKLDVLIVGPPARAKGRVIAHLQPAQAVFADSAAVALGHLERDQFDVLIVDESVLPQLPSWSGLALPAHAQRILMRDHGELAGCSMLGAEWFEDSLALSMSNDELRVRLRLARLLAAVGRHLTEPPDWLVPPLAIDAPSGLFGSTFLAAYKQALRASDLGSCGSITLAPESFPALVAERGFFGTAAWLRHTAMRIARRVRAYDLVSHHADGRFEVVLRGCDADELPAIGERLAAGCDGGMRVVCVYDAACDDGNMKLALSPAERDWGRMRRQAGFRPN